MVYVTCHVVDSSGSPLNNVEVTAYQQGFFSGVLDQGSSGRNGIVELKVDIGSSDKFDLHAKGEVRWSGYPQAEVKVVVR